MKPSSRSLSRLLLALVLFFGLCAHLVAGPASRPTAVAGREGPPAVFSEWFDWVPYRGAPTRSTVIRVAALGMLLALVIMYRNKH